MTHGVAAVSPLFLTPTYFLFCAAMRATLTAWAKRIKQDTVMLWFARRHPATPLMAKALCILAVAYALSPIDLIPDFIPVLGLLDELILLPAMIWLAVRLLPEQVVEFCRRQATQWLAERKAKPRSYTGAAVIVVLWLGVAYALWHWQLP
jgi:uncharacterized membrane protein YkvA (DUF1232 family)